MNTGPATTRPAPLLPPIKASEGTATLSTWKKIDYFITGTGRGMLDGMAEKGRIGSFIGLGLGMIALVASAGTLTIPAALPILGGQVISSFVIPITGWFCGLLVGAALGGAAGLLRGGTENMALEMRRAEYADEIAERKMGRRVSSRGTAAGLRNERERIDNINEDRFLQYQDRVLEAPKPSNYWQEQVRRDETEGFNIFR
jgi:hypothetical protein